MSIGEQIDHLQGLRERKKEVEAVVSAITQEIEEAETALYQRMESEGLESATGTAATARRDESVRPSLTDWEKFCDFVYENKYFHLFERRPSVSGCRELFQNQGAIPGVVPFVKRVVRMTKI